MRRSFYLVGNLLRQLGCGQIVHGSQKSPALPSDVAVLSFFLVSTKAFSFASLEDDGMGRVEPNVNLTCCFSGTLELVSQSRG